MLAQIRFADSFSTESNFPGHFLNETFILSALLVQMKALKTSSCHGNERRGSLLTGVANPRMFYHWVKFLSWGTVRELWSLKMVNFLIQEHFLYWYLITVHLNTMLTKSLTGQTSLGIRDLWRHTETGSTSEIWTESHRSYNTLQEHQKIRTNATVSKVSDMTL